MDPLTSTLTASELIAIASGLTPDAPVCLTLPASVIHSGRFSSSGEQLFALIVERTFTSPERPEGSQGKKASAGSADALKIALAPGELMRLLSLRKTAIAELNELFGDEQQMLFELVRAQRELRAALDLHALMVGRAQAGHSVGEGLESTMKAVDDAIAKVLACDVPVTVPDS